MSVLQSQAPRPKVTIADPDSSRIGGRETPQTVVSGCVSAARHFDHIMLKLENSLFLPLDHPGILSNRNPRQYADPSPQYRVYLSPPKMQVA